MKTKDYKGITLIALIVTIVVLIILAGVTIAMVVGDNGILTQSINAAEKTNIANTRELIEFALVDKYDEKGRYKAQDVLDVAKEITGNSLNVNKGTVLTETGSTVDISDLLNGATDIILGISDDDYGYVIGEISNGAGTGIMYVKVTGADVEDNYDTDSYPTTLCTFQEDGETHNYIFAGWYEVNNDESEDNCFTSLPTSECESAYAMFVDESILTVQFYDMYDDAYGNVHDTSENIDVQTAYIRIVSAFSTSYLNDVGFVLYCDDEEIGTFNLSSGVQLKPYYSIYSLGVTIRPSDFSAYAIYIFTYLYYPANLNCVYKAIPFWITDDGTTVYGTENSISM